MKKLLVALLLSISLQASAAITFFATSSTPADNISPGQFNTPTVTWTPPGSMTTGDLVVIKTYWVGGGCNGVATITVGTTGGQTWNSETMFVDVPNFVCTRTFWTRYNGTWAANPTFVPSSTGQFSDFGIIGDVFRPTTGTNTWAIDVAQATNSYAAPGGSFDVSITGQTSIAASTVTSAYWLAYGSLVQWSTLTGSGWAYGSQQVRNNNGNAFTSQSSAYKIQTSAGATGSPSNRMSSNRAGFTSIVTFKEVSSASTFSVSPSITARTGTTQTVGFTLTSSGNVWAVGCPIGSTAPTSAQIKAGQCTGSVTAPASGSQTGVTASTIVLTYGTPLLAYDVYVIGNYSATDTSIVSLTASAMGAAAGYAVPQPLVSVCTINTCPVKIYNDNEPVDLVMGDWFSCNSATSPDGFAITWSADGNFSYAGTAARESFICKYQDVSINAMAAGSPATFIVNNSVPVCVGPFPQRQLLKQGVTIAPTSLISNCTDPDGEVLSAAITTGTINTGLSMDGLGVATGTPSVENEAGNPLTITVTDTASATAQSTLAIGVANTLTVPACTGLTTAICTGLIQANGWLSATTSYQYSTTIAPGLVISTNPVAATEVQPFTSVTMLVSLGQVTPSPAQSGYTFAIDPDTGGNFYGVSIKRNSTAPNCAQIQAHTDGSGNPALGFGSAVSLIGEQVTLTISGITVPKTDVYLVGKSPEGVCAAVIPFIGLLKSPGTNRQYIQVDVP